MAESTTSGGGETNGEVTLYVKANSKNGKGLGDCPFSHRIMMILSLKKVTCRYIPINLTIIPPEFKTFCINAGVPIKVPVLRHGEYIVYNSNDIAYYIDKEWPNPDISCKNDAANKTGVNLFNKFCGFLRNRDPNFEEKTKNSLLDELKKINNFLESENSPGKYLNGDILSAPDCDILPKLQHVKVALKKYKNYDMPDYLAGLKQYMDDAANDPVFKNSCPSDEAIIEGWRKHFT